MNIISMGKLYDRLQEQLQSDEYKKEAEDCLKIYEKLKEIDDGKVWESSFYVLVYVTYIMTYPRIKVYRPTKIGYLFLKGCSK